MTHKFKPGDELAFDDHRNRYTRPLRVTVIHLAKPGECYVVEPVPRGRQFACHEAELSPLRD